MNGFDGSVLLAGDSVRADCDSFALARLASINSRARSSVLFCAAVFPASFCLRRPTLLLARAGSFVCASGALLADFFTPEGATGGSLLDFPGGAGGPRGDRDPPLRFCLGARVLGLEVDFLGFLLNGFDGSSFDPNSTLPPAGPHVGLP